MTKPISIIDSLEFAQKATNLKQAVIANNIANLETPGYKRRDVSFKDAFAKAVEDGQSPLEIQPEIVTPGSGPGDETGNDINLEVEMGEMIKNAGSYKTYTKLLAKIYRQIDMAIG